MIPFGPSVYTLTIALRDVQPAVCRQLVVKSETPLPKFAQMLERVMGWESYHLHMFEVGGILFGPQDDEFDSEHVIDERKVTVQQVLPRVGAQLRFDYDFGDGWEHVVVVDAIEAPLEGKRYPICLAGERACPPEDCGGVTGYEELLAALADPSSEEYEDYVEWAGDFDPERFDLVGANRRLRGR